MLNAGFSSDGVLGSLLLLVLLVAFPTSWICETSLKDTFWHICAKNYLENKFRGFWLLVWLKMCGSFDVD